jgi:RNase adapter protein RapZ
LSAIVGKATGGRGRAINRLFIECNDEPPERRYRETRRPHPFAGDRPVADGISRERRVVSTLRDRADFVIKASTFSAADLTRLLNSHFAVAAGMRGFVTSFLCRRWTPRDAGRISGLSFSLRPDSRMPLPMGAPAAAG